jgi:hypothetical protein
MTEEQIEVLDNAYDIIQELQAAIIELTKDTPKIMKLSQLELFNKSNFVLGQINDELYKTL